MDIKPGYKTTEFWLTALTAIVAPIMALFVTYGLMTNEEASVWSELLIAMLAIAAPLLASAYAVRGYTDARAAEKIESMSLTK